MDKVPFEGGSKGVLAVVYVTVYHVHGFLLEKAVFLFIQLPEPLQALFGDDQMARNYDRKRVQAYGVRNGAHAGGLKVSHCLAALPQATLSDIKTVISHPQALKQCEEFLKGLKAQAKPDENTAVAAKKVAESGDLTVAALCSKECAEIYGLKVLKDGVQTSDANYTRFILIKKDLCIYKGADKMSVMTSLPHESGSLNRLLGKFSALGLNLTKLHSHLQPSYPKGI